MENSRFLGIDDDIGLMSKFNFASIRATTISGIISATNPLQSRNEVWLVPVGNKF